MKQRSKLVREKNKTKKHSVALKMDGSRLDPNEEEKINPKKDQRRQKTKHFTGKSPANESELDKSMMD